MKTEISKNGQSEEVDAKQYRPGTATLEHQQNRLARPDADSSFGKVQKQSLFRRPGVIIIAAVLAIVGIGYGGIVMFHAFTHETTDDAFVDVHAVSVAPKIAGQVAVVRVNDNQLVKKGDVLVEIDPRDFQVALAQAKANLSKDKATQIQTDLNEKRALELFAEKVISTQERDSNIAAADASRAAVQADEAAVKQAELNLSYTKIPASLDGYVTNEAVAIGDYLQVGQALLSLVPPQIAQTSEDKT